MKQFYPAIFLSASFLLLIGCSDSSFQRFSASQSESASAQTLSPSDSYERARELAWEAAVLVQHPPHPEETWQDARVKWRQAIRLLEAIPEGTSVSKQAKRKLADYRIKHKAIEQRLINERTATDNFNQAQTIAWQAAVTAQNSPHSLKVWQRAREKWKQALQLASAVPTLTTVSQQAQKKTAVYRSNFVEIDRRLADEHRLLQTAKRFSNAASRLHTLQTEAIAGQSVHPIGMDYESYKSFVRSLQKDLQALKPNSVTKSHPIYVNVSKALSDYEFALKIWQTYQQHRQANAEWLGDDDFFNQLVPLSLIGKEADKNKLLSRYKVKLHQGIREPKVPLKFAVWAIWEVAREQSRSIEQNAANLN